MPLDDAFLQDIVDHPDEDAPRLIFADWLEEQGAAADLALSEFIRTQCELEQLDEGPRRWQLRQRERALLSAYRSAWVAPLRELVLAEEFRRGFVEGVTLTLPQFLERADEVFARAPIRRLRLTGSVRPGPIPPNEATDQPSLLRQVAASPHLAQLRSLCLEMALGAEEVAALAEAPYLTGLTDLEVACPELEEWGVRVLLGRPHCARLRRLSLGSGQFSSAALRAVADAPELAGLTSLSLRGHLSAEDLRALGASPHLTNLAVLDLNHNRLEGDVVRNLGEGPLLARLRTLRLSGNGIAYAGAQALAEVFPTGRLRTLELASNGISSAGITALASCPALADLCLLDLRDNIASSSGLTELASSPFLGRLEALLLHFNGIGDPGVRALARSPQLANLVWLDLVTNRITSDGAASLARSPYLQRLTRLELMRNDIGPLAEQALRDRFGAVLSI